MGSANKKIHNVNIFVAVVLNSGNIVYLYIS